MSDLLKPIQASKMSNRFSITTSVTIPIYVDIISQVLCLYTVHIYNEIALSRNAESIEMKLDDFRWFQI